MAEPLYDGNTDFLRGQDASKDATQVSPAGYFSGINITAQNGSIDPRFQFRRKTLAFASTYIEAPNKYRRTLEVAFKSGKFQAWIPYSIGAKNFFVVVVNGHIFLFDTTELKIELIPLAGAPLDETKPRINWSLSKQYLELYDFPSYPVIVEGTTARRADPAKNEVPISTMGAYNDNRLFVADAGQDFAASDPTGALAFPGAPITFNEMFTPSSPFINQTFTLPTAVGNSPISAMTFLPLRDSSTGIGSLLVATKNTINAYATNQPRAQWLAGQFGASTLFNNGIVGTRAFTGVNGDLWFVSEDGQLRSLSMSRDEQGKWSNRPMSREVRNYLKAWDRDLIQYVTVTYFKNKLFVTCNPFRTVAQNLSGESVVDIAHGGFVSLSLDNLSEISEENPPAWDGLWTGMRPMDIAVSGDRCFAISKEGGENVIWEIVDTLSGYDTWEGKRRTNLGVLYTKEYDFKDMFLQKEAQSLEPQIENIEGKFKFEVDFKASHAAKYVPWGKLEHDAPAEICSIPEDFEVNGLESQGLLNPQLGSPTVTECDPVNKSKYTYFKKLQLRVKMLGDYWTLHGLKIGAVPQPQNPLQKTCTKTAAVKVFRECDTDWIYEEFSECQR